MIMGAHPARPQPGPSRRLFRMRVGPAFVLLTAGVIAGGYPSPGEAQQATPSAHVVSDKDGIILVRIPVHSSQRTDTVLPSAAQSAVGEILPLGSHIALLHPSELTSSPRRITNLTPGFAVAGRPDISFDAKRILFVGKRTPEDRFGIWEMNSDGTGLRQITTGFASCSAAIYLSTLYAINVGEPTLRIAFCAASSIFTCEPNGGRIRQITFNPYGVRDPYLLSDGRLLYASESAHVNSGTVRCRASSFFTVNIDGTDVSGFTAAGETAARIGMPCETADGWVIFVESEQGGWNRGGALVGVRRARSLHTSKVVAAANDGPYRSPAPLADGNLLVSHRAEADDSYGVYVLDPQTGMRIAQIIDSPEWHEVDAHALQPRPVPAGRSSVVDERSQTGLLYCVDASLTDALPGKVAGRPRIRRLQVFRAAAHPDGDSIGVIPPTFGGRADAPSLVSRGPVGEELLGEVPVESDGSFFLEVPAMTPVRLQTLAADGAVLGAMQSWIWVMPNEARGCIGCHEDRELTPPNRHPLALRRAPRHFEARGRRADPRRNEKRQPPGSRQ